MKSLEDLVYNMIDSKAKDHRCHAGSFRSAGMALHHSGGRGGCVYPLRAPLLNDIRTLYGRKPVDVESIVPIIRGCSTELLADLVLDKLVGQIPLSASGPISSAPKP